ncbi:2-dehydro-3-deoxygluconate kinase [Bradyrhizobiaceae bacterium SG-6C]|nr:2-dehydro-3-deoxygluconate kinase [Bradyrhizobiaceae bacterium SG-6C]
MTTVACIGECMIELSQGADHIVTRGYGGDTLNTAVYLARLGVSVDYVTALGDDPFSEEMLKGWVGEGVGISRVMRVPGKLPGLYAIRTSEAGERSFYYWRENSAARQLLDLPETDDLLASLAGYDVVYLSGITLSLYGADGRRRLIEALKAARKGGARIAFDTNFRMKGWPDLDIARQVYRDMLAVADIVLASVDDLTPLFGSRMHGELIDRMAAGEVVLKLAEPGSVVRYDGVENSVKAEPVSRVVDTTAAGDSFAAAYLAARLGGIAPAEAARAGHRLAGTVVGHRGAIIPRDDMPSVNVAGRK